MVSFEIWWKQTWLALRVQTGTKSAEMDSCSFI